MTTSSEATAVAEKRAPKRKFQSEMSMLVVLVGIALTFEVLGWIFVGNSFLANQQRLSIIILQVSVIGILAVGVTHVIITGGIDLASGSVVGLTAMVAASLAQSSTDLRALYPALTDLSPIWPILAGLIVGLLAGWISGVLIAKTAIPPFIATLGMMVCARGVAKWYTMGQPIALLTPEFTWLGKSFLILGFPVPLPVLIFLAVAILSHIALSYTRYGKYTYAIGSNPQAARVSGIDIGSHLIKVYAVAGLLSGLAGVVTAARAASAQPTMGTAYELDAIAAAVIGGTSLAGGAGRITGTLIGTIILGVITSGFTYLKIGSYYQEIIKGAIIVFAVVIDQYRRSRKIRA
ncbi:MULTISPECIES: ABC transporter permease [Agrobacterium]|jgi:inositol transport system permease protein|uniref:ABC transporter permease n=5 Tax=Rhizobium/Agrobacterium group TaxID=227290 RepID=A0A4D7YVS4_AGRTU|nr:MULTISPECIES: ABC transporter permease [Agrobacterium]KJF69923.1 ABC transporter [Agrobacterium arsenijevicii]QCL98086.1 ABC transporter permease [Agrobacterium tumefaciens]QCL98097.1 ABC transporter permease [Agrobacterium tumefaciens]QKX00619.1 ABC transporter permease [Agrobacterium sp. CGMCC 11546]QKX00628.1 ABC transporter permease [Agrobacterium sp. CGMCC 11546]